MKKFLQILSCVLLLMNPAAGFMCVATVGYSYSTGTYWWIVMFALTPLIVTATLKFHFYMYRVENRLQRMRYNKWEREFSKTHTLVNKYAVDYGGETYSLWRNKETGELVAR